MDYTLNAHILASFWARDSSKKAFCSSWLALSNGMESEGSAGRAVHVQGDWKLCTCTARRKKIFKPGSRWIRILRQKLYPGAKNLGNRRNFCKQLGSALSDSTTVPYIKFIYKFNARGSDRVGQGKRAAFFGIQLRGTLELDLLVQQLHVIYDNDVTAQLWCHYHD